jgi:aminopeptidase N
VPAIGSASARLAVEHRTSTGPSAATSTATLTGTFDQTGVYSRNVPTISHRLLLVPLVVLTLVAGSTVAGSPANAQAHTDTLFPKQGHPGYDARHYDVRLAYDPATNRLAARTTVRAHTERRLKTYALDLVGMKVRSVRVDGRPARFLRTAEHLVIHPRQPVSGRFTTTVTYAGVPEEIVDADGSTEGWVRTDDGAIALGEPVGTMAWIPSDNTPGDKARYRFEITVPRGVQAAANGDLVSRTRRGPSSTWTWRVRDRMASYLAMVAIGRFTVHRSATRSVTGRKIPIWSFVDPTTGTSEAARAALPRVLRFQERLFGPYPLSSAGMVVDDASVGYALETQNRPFYPNSVDGATLVHESAHQWFGNSVTLRDWHDIWLPEGFATYAEWLWSGAHGGQTPAERFDDLYDTPASSGLWSPAPTEFTDPADLFGEPVYSRGAMTLQALRERIGDADFFGLLKRWAAVYRQGNAGTAQLVALAEQVSGEQLDELFADWLELDGRPSGY